MKGVGPKITKPIIGRHGGEFYWFGDYAVDLFEHVEYYGNPPSRALFDMAAVAIVKNTSWAKPTVLNGQIMVNKKWVSQPNNSRKIVLLENFDKAKIINDFFMSMPQ